MEMLQQNQQNQNGRDGYSLFSGLLPPEIRTESNENIIDNEINVNIYISKFKKETSASMLLP